MTHSVAEIRNGEITKQVAGVVSDTEDTAGRPKPSPEIIPEPEAIAAMLAAEISSWVMDSAGVGAYNPMELVNRLLQLQSPEGKKLLFTRWDLFQCFALWTNKLTGREKI